MNNINRPIQEIFNAVIDAGCYTSNSAVDEDDAQISSSYMCIALDIAYKKDIITGHERIIAKNNIEIYIFPYAFLATALQECGLSGYHENCLKVYKDWANRPKLNFPVED